MQISNEELIRICKEKAAVLKRTPTKRELGEYIGTIKWRFGSWNNFIELCGMPVNRRKYSKADIAKFLTDFFNKNGRAPTVEEFDKNPCMPDPSNIRKMFNKSWNGVLIELGLPINCEHPTYNLTDEQLLAFVKNEVEKNKNTSWRIFNKNRSKGVPSENFYKEHFNKSWNEILKMAGIEEIWNTNVSCEDVLADMLRVYNENKELSVSIYDMKGKYNYKTVMNKFGSWNKAKMQLQMKVQQVDTVTETKEELLQQYIQFSKMIGRKNGATTKDLDNSEIMRSSSVYIIRFGSMYELREKAGFAQMHSMRGYTKEEIKELLITEYKRIGRRLTQSEVKKNEYLPALKTICAYYHTTKISVVWDEIEKIIKKMI